MDRAAVVRQLQQLMVSMSNTVTMLTMLTQIIQMVQKQILKFGQYFQLLEPEEYQKSSIKNSLLQQRELHGLKCQISWNLPPARKSQLCQPENLANLKPQREVIKTVLYQITK
ncbi:Hypothetical_protein [Hexamita inflata]|uniref:Hypothetical_protein n=1 Tax=Hexamita inflata TaxID=28002 RepID=A0AA86NMY1_9EUKA|nr:Hypothetical protein HINF_LOCUS10078 [Hexamita inflata]